jgi:hypothetical protein
MNVLTKETAELAYWAGKDEGWVTRIFDYEVHIDPKKLASLVLRANRNKSRSAVDGPLKITVTGFSPKISSKEVV